MGLHLLRACSPPKVPKRDRLRSDQSKRVVRCPLEDLTAARLYHFRPPPDDPPLPPGQPPIIMHQNDCPVPHPGQPSKARQVHAGKPAESPQPKPGHRPVTVWVCNRTRSAKEPERVNIAQRIIGDVGIAVPGLDFGPSVAQGHLGFRAIIASKTERRTEAPTSLGAHGPPRVIQKESTSQMRTPATSKCLFPVRL